MADLAGWVPPLIGQQQKAPATVSRRP